MATPKAADQTLPELARSNLSALARLRALDDIKRVGMTALGGGALVGGLAGLAELVGRNRRKRPEDDASMGAIRVPIPIYRHKLASIGDRVAELQKWMKGIYTGERATTPEGIWWNLPAQAAVGIGGAGLGFLGARALARQVEKKQLNDDLEDARSDFHRAMLEQYQPGPASVPAAKRAYDAVGDLFDDLCDAGPVLAPAVAEMRKLGFDFSNVTVPPASETSKQAGETLDNTAGNLAGWYGTAAMLAALAAGTQAYGWARKRDPNRILRRALKERRREEYARTPPVFIAVPATSSRQSINDPEPLPA